MKWLFRTPVGRTMILPIVKFYSLVIFVDTLLLTLIDDSETAKAIETQASSITLLRILLATYMTNHDDGPLL